MREKTPECGDERTRAVPCAPTPTASGNVANTELPQESKNGFLFRPTDWPLFSTEIRTLARTRPEFNDNTLRRKFQARSARAGTAGGRCLGLGAGARSSAAPPTPLQPDAHAPDRLDAPAPSPRPLSGCRHHHWGLSVPDHRPLRLWGALLRRAPLPPPLSPTPTFSLDPRPPLFLLFPCTSSFPPFSPSLLPGGGGRADAWRPPTRPPRPTLRPPPPRRPPPRRLPRRSHGGTRRPPRSTVSSASSPRAAMCPLPHRVRLRRACVRDGGRGWGGARGEGWVG